MRTSFIAAALALTLGGASAAHAGDVKVIDTANKDDLGPFLVTGEGTSVYLFKKDSPGTSRCHGACAKVWPPVTADTVPTAKGKAKAGKLDTFERKDGTMQVTYNGWPLYTYVKDQMPGDTKGQDIKGFGAEWYLVTPKGTPAHAEGHGEAHHEDSGGGYSNY